MIGAAHISLPPSPPPLNPAAVEFTPTAAAVVSPQVQPMPEDTYVQQSTVKSSSEANMYAPPLVHGAYGLDAGYALGPGAMEDNGHFQDIYGAYGAYGSYHSGYEPLEHFGEDVQPNYYPEE